MAVNTPPISARSFWPYFIVTGALSMGYGSVFTLLAEFREKFGFSETELGFIAGVGFFAGFMAQVGLSRFADRGYIKLMVRAGVLVAVVSMVGMALADEVWHFTAARFFLGAGTGATGPAIRRILIVREPANMGKNLGLMGAFDISGFVLGPLVAGVLAELVNLRAPFLCLAGIYIAIFVWTLRLDLSAGQMDRARVPVMGLFKIRPLLAGLLVGVAFYTTIGVFEASWAVLLDDLGASTLLIALSISLFAAPMIPLAPLGGMRASRLGPMRVLPFSILGAVACMLVYGYVEFVWVLIGISAVHAMFDAFTMPAGQLSIGVSAPMNQAAAAQGLYGAVGLIVSGVASVAAGTVYDVWGPEALFTGASVFMIIALIGAMVLGEELTVPVTRPKPSSEPAGTGEPASTNP